MKIRTTSTFAKPKSGFNFNELANTDSELCVPYVEGCLNPLALNYNEDANVNSGCILPNYGCTDQSSFNYDEDSSS